MRVVLAEKELEYTLVQVNPYQPPPEFLAISPLRKMPAFVDTSLPEPNAFSDSSVICDYIEHKYPNPPVYPQEPYARARALWFEEYADSQMAANIVRPFFFERIVKKLIGQQTDESVCEAAKAKHLPEVCDYLEKELGRGEYFAGNAFFDCRYRGRIHVREPASRRRKCGCGALAKFGRFRAAHHRTAVIQGVDRRGNAVRSAVPQRGLSFHTPARDHLVQCLHNSGERNGKVKVAARNMEVHRIREE